MDRFWSRVEQSGTCLLWTGASTQGYGRVWYLGKVWLAHRVAWHLKHGSVPDELDHLRDVCSSKLCVNTDHLEDVTHRENVARGAWGDKWAERAAQTHCSKGHEFTEENTYAGKRQRDCRTCRRERSIRYSRKKGIVPREQYLESARRAEGS